MPASSYGSAKATQTFYLSETPNGEHVHEDDDTEHTLEVRFTTYSFTERHPYGDGYAEEHLSEIVEDSYEYELDGVEVERDELDERFGSKWISQLLDKMETNATVCPLEPDYD